MGDARTGGSAPPRAPAAPRPTAPPVEFAARPAEAATRSAAAAGQSGAATAAWRQAAVARRAPAAEGIDELATDAPAHWPRVQAPRTFLERRGPGYTERFAAGIRRTLEEEGFPVVEERGVRLLDSGVLEIPFLVADGAREVPVFVYPRGDAKASAHFAGVRKLLAAVGAEPPVHYAASPLRPVPAANPCVPLRLEHLRPVEERPAGRFAMWWASPGDADFQGSVSGQAIRRYYQAMDGRESHLYARVLRAFGGPDVGLTRAALPPEQERFSLPVQGPGGETLYVTASREKGVRFHFDKENTPAAYRDRFWRHFATYAEQMAQELASGGAYKEAYYEDRPLRWLEDVERNLRVASAGRGEDDRMVGAHIVTPLRSERR